MYDEPFADSSQIPTHLVAALARQHVTVGLSGDGGDELFGGYNRYFIGAEACSASAGRASCRGAPGARPSADRRSRHAPGIALGAAGHGCRPACGRRMPANGSTRWRACSTAADPDAMYFELVSHWSSVVIGGRSRKSDAPTASGRRSHDPVERMMYFDQVSYLPDDILAKVDRASMAVSLEVREPLLDHRLVELAWTLPLVDESPRRRRESACCGACSTATCRDALIDRPKMGFGMPLERWLRGRLRDWAESLLDPATIRREGWLDDVAIRAEMGRAPRRQGPVAVSPLGGTHVPGVAAGDKHDGQRRRPLRLLLRHS